MEELKVVARHIRHQAALDLLRDGEVDGIAALALVLIPPENVLAASIKAAELKLAQRSDESGGAREHRASRDVGNPRHGLRSRDVAPREIVWAHR